MDSRIEELAQIIFERAGDAAKNVERSADGLLGDRHRSWTRLHSLAREMKSVIDEYRKAHPEEYEDTEILRMRAREKELHQDIVSLRNELRTYTEREKTMGWSQI